MSANVMVQKSNFTISVDKTGGRIQLSNPITVKNQIQEIRSIDLLNGVNTANRVDSATFVYNANTGQYDVKLLDKLYTVSINTLIANGNSGETGQVLSTDGNSIFWTSVLSGAYAEYAETAGIATKAYNADSLGGLGWESPGRIGYQIPDSGNFTEIYVDSLYVNGVAAFASLLIDGGNF